MDARTLRVAAALCVLAFALISGTASAVTNIRTLSSGVLDNPGDLRGFPEADSAITAKLTVTEFGKCGLRRIGLSNTLAPTISTVAGFDCGTTNAGGPYSNADPSNPSTRLGTVYGMSVSAFGDIIFGTGPGTCFGGCMVHLYHQGSPGDIDTIVNTSGTNCPGTPPADNSAASSAIPCYIQDLEHSQSDDKFLIVSANAGGITNRVFEVDISANTIRTVAGSCQTSSASLALRYCFAAPVAAAYVGDSIVVADNPSGTSNDKLVLFSRTSTATAGAAMNGSFFDPTEIADGYDNGFFVATENCTVKHVSSPTVSPAVRTVAGGACANPSADDTIKPATQATFAGINGLYLGQYGLHISDGAMDRVRLVERASITSGPPAYSNQSQAQFTFEGLEDNHTFVCTLLFNAEFLSFEDACTSGQTYPVTDGSYEFRMRPTGPYLGGYTQTYAFQIDRTPPSPSALRDPAAGATGVPPATTFTWGPAADNPSGVTAYELHVDGSKTADISCPPADGDACTKATVTVAEGEHRWFVRAKDRLGQSSDSETRAFTAGGPPVASLSIAPNPALAGRTVTFDGSGSSDAHGPIARFEWDLDGDGQFETDTGTAATATRSYNAPGTFPITLRVTDGSGNTATATGELRVTQAPSASGQFGVTINNGAQYTKSADVVVNASFPAATTAMLFSNDGGFLAPTTFAPKTDVQWKLDSSGPERLPKTIYVRFLTGPFVSETHQDDIILDETPPKVEQAALVPAASVASVARVRSYRLRLKASDSNSGVAKVQVTASKRKPGKLLTYKRKLTVKAAARPRWVRARDRAGNLSRWRAIR